MNVYETIFILDSSRDDAGAEEAVSKIKYAISAAKGEVLKVERWGRRKLAYLINKHSRGNYVYFLYQAPSTANSTLEELAKVSDEVVKFMIVKLEKKQRDHALAALKAAEERAAQPQPVAEPASAPEPAQAVDTGA